MYRHADEPPQRPEAALPHARPERRKFAPVPLGVASAFIALGFEFLGLWALALAISPTSIGCGAPRAFSMTGGMVVVSLGVFGAMSAVGMGIMRDARESQLRRRSYLITFTAFYVLGSIPLFVAAALFGSCFDF
jgi:hypothetical protein